MKHYICYDFGQVYPAGRANEVCGKEDVWITTPNRSVLQLNGVRHILCLRRNLVSIGQLDDESYVVIFDCNNWKITNGAML